MKLIFLSLIFQLLTLIKVINSLCSNGVKITNTDCFNNLIILPAYYRGAQFSTNKEGNMIIEYSRDQDSYHGYRLFYGFQKNGRDLFDGYYKIFEIGSDQRVKGRYEARNIFVSLENDINKDKEYLFSTSAYDTLTELYDIEEDKSLTKETLKFWDIIDIFSYQYSLFELRHNNKNIYFCIFTQHENHTIEVTENGVKVQRDYSETFSIKKFSFNSFNLENYNDLKTLNNTHNFNDRIISSFLMESEQVIVVFYIKSSGTDYVTGKYAILFYDYDLNEKNEIFIMGNDNINQPRSGDGLFFKGLFIKDNYAAFIYYTKGFDDTKIQFNITTLEKDSNGKYLFKNKIQKIQEYGFISDIILNEFIKIDNERFAFISTKKPNNDNFKLYILLYDLYDDYSKMKIREYNYDLDNYQLRKESTAYVFNGFLIFSSTAVTPPDYVSSNYISLLVFFGYPNGTDFTIDMSLYVMDTDYYESTNNIFNYLMSKIKVENNIFGYETVQKINLLSIPPELLFYNITDGVVDSEPLPNNSFFDENHKLYQNKALNKTFKDYYLDYQYIVKEPEYSNFYSSPTEEYPNAFDASEYFNSNRKTFYGRANRLTFKLCYNYCDICLEFGKYIYDQKCLTCLEQYSYDYWIYIGKYFGNCVEENKYYDEPNKQMINCDYTNNNFKYLINSDNKKICFKNEDKCPDLYSNYNTITGECEYTPCNFDFYLNKRCSFVNDPEGTILEKMRDLLPSYSNKTQGLIANLNDSSLEMTNDKKELLFLNDTDLPWIDLAKCGEILRAYYRNNSYNETLLIIKYGILSEISRAKYLQYEVYDPDNYEKYNLSICKGTDVNIYINIPLTDEQVKILKNIIDQGYNPFDINDKFYREICTPYDSENGTDVLLDSREEYYYSSLNEIKCPDNCHSSSFNLDSKYLKCECEVNDTDITLNLKHITGENIGNSFYSTLKNSNWKVMICYNLVFNLEVFSHNSGSILSLILFIIYVGFIVLFIIRGIEPLQIIISKFMFKENLDNKISEINSKSTNDNPGGKKPKKKTGKRVKIKNFPPKKHNTSKRRNNGITIFKDTASFNESKKLNTEKLMTNQGTSKKEKSKIKKELIYTEGANLRKKTEITKRKDDEIFADLDDFQYNNLEYENAVKYDKRSFLRTYWSVLMREHLVLITFVAWKDYNLFYVKIDRFLVLICTQMTMNGLFFSDESMRKANKSDDYNFVQQLPKIIFSLIATHLIEVALCYFSMTDKTIYLIKELSKNRENKENEKKVIDVINCMKKKLIAFYVVTFLLFLFYWYFISAFCAVYQNTQKTFLLDSLISIIVEFIDPFFIYGFTTLLRYLSLTKCANKNMKCLYKTSDLIPIF